MDWVFILICALLIFALGFLLGLRQRYIHVKLLTPSSHNQNLISEKQYFTGLNYLLNDQTDEAIDAFVQAFQVNSQTIETHLALGNLLRRRGEIDKAIQIHQNLLANSVIGNQEINRVSLELARDFLSAGLLDRAERLLKKLAGIEGKSPSREHSLQWQALDVLVDIYQQTKDWDQAIWAGEQLIQFDRQKYKDKIAQFFCEKAQLMLNLGNFEIARSCIERAAWYDNKCVRASLLAGELEYKLGNNKQSIKVLKKINQQDAELFIEAIPWLERNYELLKLEQEWIEYLHELLLKTTQIQLLLLIFTMLSKDNKQNESLCVTMIEKLKPKPSLQALKWLIETKFKHENEDSKNLLLVELVEKLVDSKAKYCCHHCGFSSKVLYWLCPSCRQWDTIRPITV